MAPKSNHPNKIEVKMSVPEPLLQQAVEIAQQDGYAAAEFHRMCWVLGLQAYAERSNKVLVNEKMRGDRLES